MAKKYLYGNLNQDTVRPNYGGSTTDSVTIHVDNDKMVISGEVNWDSALGELAHKAYPGDKGARNYQKILELTAKLDEEIAAAGSSREAVETTVGVLEKSFNELNEQLIEAVRAEASLRSDGDTLSLDRCRSEAERALAAEEELLTKLLQEAKTRETVDNELILRLDQLSGLSGSSLEEIRQLVSVEASRAQEVEQSIIDKMDAEATRAQSAEQQLSKNLTAIQSTVATTTENLSKQLVEEHSARVLDTQLLTEVVENEIDRATLAEEALISDIAKVETAISSIDNVVKELYEVVSSLEASDNNVESTLNSVTAELTELEAETTSSLAALEKDISSLKTTHTADIKRIDKDVTAVEKSVASNVNLISKLTTKLNETTKHLSTVDTTIRNVQASIAAETDARKAADSATDKKLSSTEKTLSQKDAELATTITAVENKTVNLTSSLQQLEGTVKTLSTQVNELYAADVVTEDEFNQLSEQLKTVYNNIGELSSSIEQEVVRATEKDNELSVAVEAVDAKYLLIDSILSTLSDTTQHLTTVTELLDTKVQSIASSCTMIAEEVAQVKQEVADARQALISEHDSRVDSENELRVKISNVQESIESFQPQIDANVAAINSARSDISAVEAQLLQSNENVTALAEVVDVAIDRLSGVQDELDNTTARIDDTLADYKDALVKHDVDNHQQDVEIEDLKKSIELLTSVDTDTDAKIQEVEQQATADRELHLSHYSELVNRIEQEIKRAVAADAELFSDTERNSGRITSLQLELTDVISRYVEELRQADSQLNDKIDYEHIYAEENKQHLTDQISDVEQDSIQRDNALQAQIEIITGKKDSVPLMENEGDMPEVYAQQGDKTFTIPTEKAVVPEAIVRRDSVGNVLLSTDDEAFTTHSAVSKLFVENVVAELRKEISSISFDFIDGGNAPIG